MRTVLNVLNFVLGGFATTLSWLFATLVSIVLIFTLPLTRSLLLGNHQTLPRSLWK